MTCNQNELRMNGNVFVKQYLLRKRAMSFYQSNQQARLTENSFNRDMLKEKTQISNKAKQA